MRKTVLLAAAMLALVVAASGVAWAADVVCDGGECFGTDGDDAILGSDVRDDIYGLDGNDTVRGRGGPDRVSAGGGDNLVRAGGGHDFVRAQLDEDDDSYGDSGRDTLRGGGSMFGGGGRDDLASYIGDSHQEGGPGDDRLAGAPSAMLGGDGDDFLRPLGTLADGGLGGDTIRAANGEEDGGRADSISCGPGRDTVFYDRGEDRFVDPVTFEETRGEDCEIKNP